MDAIPTLDLALPLLRSEMVSAQRVAADTSVQAYTGISCGVANANAAVVPQLTGVSQA